MKKENELILSIISNTFDNIKDPNIKENGYSVISNINAYIENKDKYNRFFTNSMQIYNHNLIKLSDEETKVRDIIQNALIEFLIEAFDTNNPKLVEICIDTISFLSNYLQNIYAMENSSVKIHVLSQSKM